MNDTNTPLTAHALSGGRVIRINGPGDCWTAFGVDGAQLPAGQHGVDDDSFNAQRKAHAAAVVEAVNSHARLLAERDEAVAALRDLVSKYDSGTWSSVGTDNARALLARIGGE